MKRSILLITILFLSVNLPAQNITLPAYQDSDQIIDHFAYTLCYDEEHEQARWVAYKLTKENMAGTIKRKDNFRIDPDVSTGSATLDDYKGSGFDRGHLAPAADMKWSDTAMSESFFMSNMSPQVPGFNRGIWKLLESQVRRWAHDNEEIFVVTGPVLTGTYPTIGSNAVSVPEYYYKAVLDYKEPELKAIAFILPNQKSDSSIQSFAVTIDSVEHFTGHDFFPAISDSIEEKLESSIDLLQWNLEAPKTVIKQPIHIKTEPKVSKKRCKAITKKGAQCKRNAEEGSDYCWQHKK